VKIKEKIKTKWGVGLGIGLTALLFLGFVFREVKGQELLGLLLLVAAGVIISAIFILGYLEERDKEREEREVAATSLLLMLQKLGASLADLGEMRDAVDKLGALPPRAKKDWDETILAMLSEEIARIKALPPSARTAFDEALLAMHLRK